MSIATSRSPSLLADDDELEFCIPNLHSTLHLQPTPFHPPHRRIPQKKPTLLQPINGHPYSASGDDNNDGGGTTIIGVTQ
jgi:hypothetical protein